MKNMLIILVAIVVISGGVYVYLQTDKKEASKDVDQVATTTVIAASSTVVVTATTTNKPTSTTTLKGSSCGTVVDTHVFVESEKRTAAEIKALTCISEAAVSCTPAYLDVTGTDAGSYQILSRSGENCSIVTTFGSYKKCDVPVKVITDLKEYSVKEKKPIEDLITIVNLLMAFGEGKDIKTGETIKLSCQS